MNEILEISNEFIEENHDLCKVVQKKHTPYSKKDRIVRRKEVFKLYFEHGYSAISIADMMQVHRNTINEDLKYWYNILAEEWFNNKKETSWLSKYSYRLEAQRLRLFKMLDKEPDTQTKLTIERLIYDVDSKMMQFLIKMELGQSERYENLVKIYNHSAKQAGLDSRYVSQKSLVQTSTKTYQKIEELLRKDSKSKYLEIGESV